MGLDSAMFYILNFKAVFQIPCGNYIKGELNAKANLFLFESIGVVD